jgi:putative drug exporter of the RND superfamily
VSWGLPTSDSTKAGRIFGWLGSFVVRWPLLVIALWIALPAVLVLDFPSLSQRAAERPITVLPDDAPSIATNQQMTDAFQAPATRAPETQLLDAEAPRPQPPATQPPATQPPATQPPATQPPATQVPDTPSPRMRDAGKQGAGTDNILLVVLTNENGLRPTDESVYRSLVEKLRQDTEHVVMMQDFISTPPLREVVTSKDHKAWYLPINLVGGLGSGEGYWAYRNVATIVKEAVAGSTLNTYLTGPATTVADITDVSQRDVHLIEIVTVVMVLTILLVIYRNVVTMLLPLVTIAVSFVTAQGVVSALAPLGLGISGQTMILMTGIMIGAGTDYAVFLISRYHDFVRLGTDSDQAVKTALASVGKVIAASAATVAVTFLGMIFSQLNVFSTVGPAMSIAIAVAFFAAVTLLPAMLVLAGRRGWVAPRRDLTSRQWRLSGIRIVRRPWTHLVASLVVLAILAGCAGLVRFNYDDRKTLPASADSTLGYAAMDRHFPLNETIPQFLLIQSPHDLRTPRALADLEEMARRVSQMPGISMVRGITRPTGEPLDEAKVSHQAGEVGFRLGDAATQITERTADLDELAGGAHQLADSLGEVRGQVTEAVITVRPLVDALSYIAEQTGGEKTLKEIDNAANLIASMQELGKALSANLDIFADSLAWLSPALTALNASPICSVDASCRSTRRYLQVWVAAPGNGTFAKINDLARYLRSTQDAQTVDSTLTGLRQSLKGATDAALALGLDKPGGLQSRLATLQSGAETLADASQKLADGVQELVDANKRMGPGLSDASAFLLAMKRNASTPSMSGFYIPPEVLGQDDFAKAAEIFVSPDGHAARFLVQTDLDPFSTEAMDQINSITDTARSAQPNTALAGASISMTGFPATLRDTRDYYNHDVRLIMVVTIIVVLLILMVLLRAVVAPLYLIGSVLISYMSALGIGVITFQFILGQNLHWSVPGLTFIVLVAVGADYNMLLISRVRDECAHGVRCGVIRTVGSTGGVITAAGLIFAASMFGLVLSSISTMVQAGFVLGIGLLIDTFLVRTITVPATATLVGRANWWPSRNGVAQPVSGSKTTRRNMMKWPAAHRQPEPRSTAGESAGVAVDIDALAPVDMATHPGRSS